ncbi:GNAT family N-acetyltransferase [Streptomyces sp. NPDC102274]|uniref:GNAT family N-acetyltransferase n=1 Tax=Streptomyces sp. NPDC102274 TaxID=3366151 RepID=UPI003829275A
MTRHNSVYIRPYIESDFSGVHAAFNSLGHDPSTLELWRRYFPAGWSEEGVRDELSALSVSRDPVNLVAIHEERVVGLIAGHDLKTQARLQLPHLAALFEQRPGTDGAFYQRDIVLRPDFQIRNTALALSDALLRHAKERGYTSIVTRTPPLNSTGIHFFLKQGYEEIFRDRRPDRVYFLKSLTV